MTRTPSEIRRSIERGRQWSGLRYSVAIGLIIIGAARIISGDPNGWYSWGSGVILFVGHAIVRVIEDSTLRTLDEIERKVRDRTS